ncbi:TM2 domain-containing protein [Mycoplasmopsis phocirhinis]|uniref:TM2 domain-containing protein n=1 Tax=Mycoplasmopsis phocirhinis TaxID=142650 RepID=A0A4P6MNV4_9BACT|nr:TM2 domain-containing protein [Mycoplasmopsis phocirhinis]QBF34376.1 TM2 domain-containing protein [Mycoplasmopsis phocirhinis]
MKNRTVLSLLSFFFGPLGIDRFYAGRVGLGVAKMLTFGGLGVWAFVDFILALSGEQRDSEGEKIKNW